MADTHPPTTDQSNLGESRTSVAAAPLPDVPIERRSTRHTGEDAALTLACATFGLWLFGAACELSHPLWVDWLVLWPALGVICVPLFAVAALARPRTLALLALAGAAAWLLVGHANAYAFILVHWVRSPGIPGSKGFEPDTIKAFYRYGGGVLLFITAALTTYGGGESGSKSVRAFYERLMANG